MASYNYGKKEIVEWLHQNFKQGDTCLDIGACDGKWFGLLGDFFKMDAVEAFKPNIDRYQLEYKYNKVFNIDIRDFEYSYYDCIILGDVLEHLSVEDGQKILQYANSHCKDIIIAIPYLLPQTEIYGNKWERHIQDDLTDEIFHQRFPGYISLWQNNQYGYYHKK